MTTTSATSLHSPLGFLSDIGLLQDEQLGSTLKSYYRLQRQDQLVDQLTALIQKSEQDLEKLCQSHYQQFVSTVDQFFLIRKDCTQLKEQVHGFSKDVEESVSPWLAKRREWSDQKQIYENILKTIEIVQFCHQAMELLSKVDALIDQQKYYSALKTLEELERYHLPSLVRYTFAQRVLNYLPSVRQRVQKAVLDNVKDWMVHIRKDQKIVGHIAMDNTLKRVQDDGMMGSSMHVLRRQASTSKSKFMLDEEVDVMNNEYVKVNLKPLYQCLHIHDVLGVKNQFKRHYDENRRLQANLILATPFSFHDKDNSGFESYLQDIAGFFIVEHAIVSTTEGFRSRASVETLWDATTHRLYDVVSESLQGCSDAKRYLSIKEIMINFIQTLEGYGYTVLRLLDLLMNFFEQYSILTQTRAFEVFHLSIMNDEGNPVVVHTQNEFQKVTRIFAGRPSDLEKTERPRFPYSFPFSQSLLVCLEQTRLFITGFFQFAEGFHQQFGEMDEYLRDGVAALLCDRLCNSLEQKLTGPVQISEIVRIWFNLDCFDAAILEVEELLAAERLNQRILPQTHSEMTSSNRRKSKTSLVNDCQQRYRECKKKVETRLFEVINKKMDDFIECQDYQFVPPGDSKSTPISPVAASQLQPSLYLIDLTTFLQTVWESTLVDLPASIKSLVYYSAIYHLSSRLLSLLLSPAAKKLSPFFLQSQFMCDLQFLKKFVVSLGDPMLPDQLLEIEQAVKICLPETQTEDYLNPVTRSKLYSRLQRQVVLSLMERIRDSQIYEAGWFENKKNAILTGAGEVKIDKAAKKKAIDNVIKALKDGAGSSHAPTTTSQTKTSA